ncbi:MAG: GC-type dockerin domain-anchored protein [Planctomycetota bacterium]
MHRDDQRHIRSNEASSRLARFVRLTAVAGLAASAFAPGASAQSLMGDTFEYEVVGLGLPNVSGTAVVGPGFEFRFGTDLYIFEVDVDETGVTVRALTVGDHDESFDWGNIFALFAGGVRLHGLDFSCSTGISGYHTSGSAFGDDRDVILLDSDSIQIGSNIGVDNRLTFRSSNDRFRVNLVPEVDTSIPFVDVYDLPGDTLPDPILSQTQINVFDGGNFARETIGAADGSGCRTQVNMYDGSRGQRLFVEQGGELNVFDGAKLERVGNDGSGPNLTVRTGGVFNLSEGGRVLAEVQIDRGGVANMSGGTLGAPPLIAPDMPVRIAGTLNMSDGYISNFVSIRGTVNMSGGLIEGGLDVRDVYIDGTSAGTPTLNMSGGRVRGIVSTFPNDSEINLAGGTIDDAALTPFLGRRLYVDIAGGEFTNTLFAAASAVSIRTNDPLQLTMSAGRIIDSIFEGGTYRIRGGGFDWDWLFQLDTFITTLPEGEFIFFGDQFTINGNPIPGLDELGDRVAVTVPNNARFRGVLEDGTPFNWRNSGNRMQFMEIFAQRATTPTDPVLVWNEGDREYGGIADGRLLDVQSGTLPPYFRAENAVVHLNGGSLGDDFILVDTDVVVTEGRAETGAISGDAAIDMQGGRLTAECSGNIDVTVTGGRFSGVLSGSCTVEQTGGNTLVDVYGSSTFVRYDGRGSYTAGDGGFGVIEGGGQATVRVEPGGTIVIKGGNLSPVDDNPFFPVQGLNLDGDRFEQFAGDVTLEDLNSTVARAHVTGFTVDGVDYTDLLQEDVPTRFALVRPGVVYPFDPPQNPDGFPDFGILEATLLDGQELRMYLNRQFGILELVLDQVPGEGCGPADTNNDGEITPADFNAWILAFNTQAPECDQNGDGQCTPADFNAWVLNFNLGC